MKGKQVSKLDVKENENSYGNKMLSVNALPEPISCLFRPFLVYILSCVCISLIYCGDIITALCTLRKNTKDHFPLLENVRI
jgi:hypothetical protein